MPESGLAPHITEAVGVFDSETALEAAVDELLSSGFDRAELSLLASRDVIKARLGPAFRRVKELEDDPRAPSTALIGRDDIGDLEGAMIGVPMYVVGLTAAGMAAAAGGPVGVALLAAAAGMGIGGALGGVLARIVDRQHARFLEDQLNRGGILLWVRTWTPEDQDKARDILVRNKARDVHIHDMSEVSGAVTTPESVVDADNLSLAEKIALLERWEFDVREMLTAEDEGMGDENGELLTRILNTLAELRRRGGAH